MEILPLPIAIAIAVAVAVAVAVAFAFRSAGVPPAFLPLPIAVAVAVAFAFRSAGVSPAFLPLPSVGPARRIASRRAPPVSTRRPDVALASRRVFAFVFRSAGVSPASLPLPFGGSPPLERGELDFSPAKNHLALNRASAPGSLFPLKSEISNFK